MTQIFLFVGLSAQSLKLKNYLSLIDKSKRTIAEQKSTNDFLTTESTEIDTYTGIFITNKDSDHEKSLKHLMDLSYRGYIFLEKPIYQNVSFENHLDKIDAHKIYVNLPIKFTQLYRILEEKLSDPNLGQLLHSRLELSYGISYKPGMDTNWRFDPLANPSGVVSTLGIHYVHLFRTLLGEIQESQVHFNQIENPNLKIGILTGEIYLKFKTSMASILLSYECPYQFLVRLTFSNALIEITDSTLKVFSPRDTYDEFGRFIHPPLLEMLEIESLDWDHALSASVSHFVNVATSSGSFQPIDWKIAKEISKIVSSR